METERYAEIYDIVSRAIDLESDKREAYIEEKTGDDLELRREVDEELASALLADTADFLDCSPVSFEEEEPTNEFSGTIIDGYEIAEYIGSGGEGIVYRAISTGELKNQVAIKILRSGLNADQILGRFQQEVRIYETLGQHPNIAHVHGAGKIGHGRPYFVMEYIEGQPIDKYCDEQKLSLRERATLLLVVFEALKHAHGNLIIHRDIKPHNILVTRDGIPKLLDFGIAKLLETDDSGDIKEDTWTEHPPLTLDYASPEQIRGGQMLGIATDVYSVGVVLYELLTGQLPLTIKDLPWEEQLRVVREEMPAPPETAVTRSVKGGAENGHATTFMTQDIAARRGTSAGPLRRELATDIKTILLFTLRKEPERRYRSIGEFSVDLKNWTDRQPLQYARNPARIERIGCWVRGNRMASMAIAMTSVMVVLGAVMWTEKQLRRKETLANTQYFAGMTGSILAGKLEGLKQAVDRAGKSEQLQTLLIETDVENRKEGLRKFVSLLAKDSKERDESIEAWAIYDSDPGATMLAHSLMEEFVGEPFYFRDYIKGALEKAREDGGTPVYISRLYFSKTQEIYKFSIARAVRANNGEIIGVITTSIATSRAMGLTEILNPRYEVVVVGELDKHREEGAPPITSDFLIIIHPNYPEVQSGQNPKNPIPFPMQQEGVLRGEPLKDYLDPVAGETGWLVSSSPVSDTGFVVIVQSKWPDD